MSRNNRGFTLVELMVAMAFIAVLLIMIAAVVIMTSRMYTQGITLRTVNQEGRLLVEDMRRTISEARPIPLEHIVAGSSNEYGMLCTGKYTYLWTYGKTLATKSGAALPLRYTDGSPVVFAKVSDTDSAICSSYKSKTGLPALVRENTFSLLDNGDRPLAVHRAKITGSPAAGIYHISLTIGTNDPVTVDYTSGGITTLGGQCRPPSQADGQSDYCAVNIFDFVVRTGSEV